jgi:hypothetical protein
MLRLIGLLVLLFAMPATAATITWSAPTGCPDEAGLKLRVEQRLGRSLDDVEARVDIVVTRSGNRFTARVATVERTLTSSRCTELADAVAVIVARIASEAIARAEREIEEIVIYAPPRPFVAAADVPNEPVDSVEPPRRDGKYVPKPWTIGARVSALSGIGLLPQVGLGGEVAVTVRAGRHLAELGMARWVKSAAQFIDGGPAKVNVDLDVTVARYGWRPALMPLRAWVAVEVGNMHGAGIRLPTAQIDDGRWIAAGTGFGIAWQMTPWIRLFGSTEAMVAIERARFSNGDMIVYAPSPMSVRTTCGLEVGWQ